MLLISPRTETSHIQKTSRPVDSDYPQEAMLRFEAATTIAFKGGGCSDELVWPWLNRYLGLVHGEISTPATEPTPECNPGTRYCTRQRVGQSPSDLAREVSMAREYFFDYPTEDHTNGARHGRGSMTNRNQTFWKRSP